MAIAISDTEYSDESSSLRRLELLGVVEPLEAKQLRLAALIRCAVCCFSDESGWNPDQEEDLTPIPRYVFLLKKFDPGIGPDFVAYARRHLLSSREPEASTDDGTMESSRLPTPGFPITKPT